MSIDGDQGTIVLLRCLWNKISGRRKRQFFLLLALTALTSVVEGISLGMVVPFLGVILSPDFIKSNAYIASLANIFGIVDNHQMVAIIVILFGVVVIISGGLRFLLLLMSAKVSNGVGSEITTEIFMRTLQQPYEVHVSRNSSEIIAGITMKANGIVYYTVFPFLVMLNSALMATALIAVLIYVNAKLAISLFIGFSFIYLAVSFVTRKMTIQCGILSNKCSVEQIKAMQEGLGSIRDIILDGTHHLFCEIFSKADDGLRRSHAKLQIIGGCPKYFIEALGLALIAIFAYFLSADGGNGLELMALLGVLAMGAQRLLPLFQQFYSSYISLSGGIPSLRDSLALLNQPIKTDSCKVVTPSFIFKNEVEMKNVYFKYQNVSSYALCNINLCIKKGDRIGLIGETGGGKSTLLDVFMQLLIHKSGLILVDGVEISDENRRAWQEIISHVPQNIYLADTSIVQNIAFGEKVDLIDIDRVKKAANAAQIAEYIDSLPSGYNTKVGENGVKMSGGQRQRIGIARALYKRSQIIVFDEATSALDPTTEENLIESMKLLDKDLTLLMISHRHKTLKNCNKVYRLSNKKIESVAQSEL